ncbi:MAG: carboxypeptidase regulatory-like domain-containing protein [candidate division WS1 bacterium]|jgi:hypothetical protein|nr:carboxypeptidase regulatory-like domain-containing protein [candidate division WS1 bacterium]
MARREDNQPSVMILLVAVTGGTIAVLVSLVGFDLLVGPEATRPAVLGRVASFMYWTQPFIYIMAGLLAGVGDSRRGPVRAPVIGLFLASLCWLLLRKQELLPSEPDIIAYLLPAGALFALVGAMVAPLIRDHVGRAVAGIVIFGLAAFIWTYLNLGSVSGVVQREVIQRAEGMTMAMQTVPVPNARVALLNPQADTVLYVTQSGNQGHYRMGKVPLGQYALRVWDPAGIAVITSMVEIERTITGGTRWQAVALPTQTQDAGSLFR